jgi:hypothetical protein
VDLALRIKPWLIGFLLYLLVANDGWVYGSFDGYAACWKYRQGQGISGPCLSVWP